MQKSEIDSLPKVFADRAFSISHTRINRLRHKTATTYYAYNMATTTLVEKITSLHHMQSTRDRL